MNAKVRWVFDLSDIYIKKKVTSGKIPTHVPTKPSTIGFTSHHRTWGTRSCKNLIKACFICRSVRSVSWSVKKALTQAKEMCDGHELAKVTSKSSFLPKEPERRISMGYCRGIGPRSSVSMFILGLRPKPRIM